MALLKPQDTNSDKEMAFDFHFPTFKKALVIFTRNPELGKVKTRLAKTVGDESALDIYKFLIQHTVKVTKDLKVDKYVFYSEGIRKNDAWNVDVFRKKLQEGNDLGERMHNAFLEIFKMGYEKAVIIGCDMFDWEKKDLEAAFMGLNDFDFVIGPATDGGYYLLGMKHPKQILFQNKEWGASSVLEQTLIDLKGENYLLLKERNDIDHFEDLEGIEAFQRFLPSLRKN